MLAWFVLVGGMALSIGAAVTWTHRIEDQRAESFATTVATARAIVTTELERQDDLLGSLEGLVSADPDMSNAQFAAWYDEAGIARRFPGGIGVGFIQRVPADGFDAFRDRQQQDPVRGLPTAETFDVLPAPELGADVCLQRLGVWESPQVREVTVPAGLDYCSPALAQAGSVSVPALLDRASTSDRPVVVPPSDLTPGLVGLFAPVYASDQVPPTRDGRRDATLGWVATSFEAERLVGPAATVAPGTGVTVSHLTVDGWEPVVSSGDAGDGMSETVPVTRDGRWSMTVRRSSASLGPSPTAQGLAVLAAGAVITGLVFALLRLVVGQRERALALVETKTQQLAHQALHDDLTGLPNRALLLDRAARMLARARREGTSSAALFLDLDDFKAVNDSLGHAAGDELLRRAAERISGCLRETDTFGRLGGDEFVVLVEDDGGSSRPERVAERIMEVLVPPFDLDGGSVAVSVSVGIARGEGRTAEQLLHDADLAMYEAKAGGKDRWTVFDHELEQSLHERRQLERDLRGAAERGELALEYQPTFDLRSGELTGAEALLRWHHPERGTVGPATFIGLAEESDLILGLGRWVLQAACGQAAAWSAVGTPLRVSVNVSARQLDHRTLVDEVADALAETGLDPGLLMLEVTETSLVRDTEETHHLLMDLKDLGVRIAIDDFGTGYSSMAYLQQFPVDCIKIDRRFIAGLGATLESEALIRTLVQLGQSLRLETIAEGIEEPVQRDALVELGCDSGQGFLLARPAPAVDLAPLLAAQRKPATRSSVSSIR